MGSVGWAVSPASAEFIRTLQSPINTYLIHAISKKEILQCLVTCWA